MKREQGLGGTCSRTNAHEHILLKTQFLLIGIVPEADGNRDVESLPLVLRRYDIYVKYALTDHYCCIRLLL
jgi:hypothetical protein